MSPAVVRDTDLSIRPLRDDDHDYELLSRWLSDPRVLEFYEGRDSPLSLEAARNEFSTQAMAEENNTPCIIEYRNEPIGYLQLYPTDPPAWGLDQFIGLPEHWNHGLGTRTVSLMLRYLFQVKLASKCVLDPHLTNLRAIRCYEKAGFRKVKLLPKHELHEGELRDCWLMETRPGGG